MGTIMTKNSPKSPAQSSFDTLLLCVGCVFVHVGFRRHQTR